MNQRGGKVLLTSLIVIACRSPILAQSAENVAVVINDLSPDSQRVGEHYVKARGLPPSNVLRIQTAVDETIERAAYVRTIERPLGHAIARAGLQDRLLYLVLTKGIPLRINGTTGLQGAQASVDSELTLLYRRLTGQPMELAGPVDNPYFLGVRDMSEARPFSHREHDIYLVTRLDAFTTEEALALIDRSQSARTEGKIVLDQRAEGATSQVGDEWMERAAKRLSAQGHAGRVVLETTVKAARDLPGVLGRYAWGAADPEQRTRRTGMQFVPGAIAGTLGSFDARTFRAPPDSWQPTVSADRMTWFESSGDSLTGDLIREGATGASGQVGETFLRGAVRPEILFPAYLKGFTLAEAFYLAMPTLSWQGIIVGDPLTAPFAARHLTRAELEEEPDATTGLPGLFSQRRLSVIAAANRDVPATALAPVVRAQTLLESDDKSGAARALAEATTLAPRVPSWLLAISSLQEQAGDYSAAVATDRAVLNVQPNNVVALNNLAFALAVHLGKPAEAQPIAKRAAALAPRVGTVLDTLAWTEHLLGNEEAASKLLGDAIRLDPKEPEIRLHAAIVYAATGLLEQSRVELQEALRLDAQLASSDEVKQLQSRLAAAKNH
jgi:uncharacterized protein (TIGR03790 family)